ncbi:ArsR/SmtB family transcription factor [Streptomyces sp. NPDC091281]|uniref:ArsR/SmtB family transcription factor n=1 Tax=Streptomyces sp. NPDC091281 TaxID=3365985 RepID=UPI003806CF4F
MYCRGVLTDLAVASDIDVLARFGRALADPIRCRVLLALRAAPAYPADLADILGVSRTRLSNHLACLRDCGLVVTVPDGRRTRYELADARLGHALDHLVAAVIAVGSGPGTPPGTAPGPDGSCPDTAEKGCC